MAGEVFQDVEGAVKSLVPLLSQLAGAINSVETSLENLDNTTKETAKTQDDLKKKTNTNTDAVKKLTKAEKAEAEILRLATKAGKKEIDAQVRLTAARKKSREEAQKNNNIIKKSGGLFKSMTKSILAAGAAMLTLRAVFSVIKNGLKTIIGFEKGMSAVKAITQATGKEFKALQSNALKLGSSTAKTAIEVAGLQKEFAKLGFSTSEILAATEATINLSIAAGSDLAEAATVAASTIRGFGFSATETGRITDVMAKSFTTTGLNLEKFKVSMANAQVAAKSTGQSFEFTAAALGTIIDTGTDASKAGTDLKNIFAELAKQGLSLDDAYKLVNGSSNKVVTAMELVGKRAFSSLITLSEQTDKVDELTVAYENSAGAAKEMADIMADNLAGDITLASSAWDGFILSLNSGNGVISKAFRSVVQAGTELINVITKLNEGESLRVQSLKKELDFENRVNEEREKSIEIIEFKAEAENISKTEAAKGFLAEIKARAELKDAYLSELEASNELAKGNHLRAQVGQELIKGATADQVAAAQVSSDLANALVLQIENVVATEEDAEKAKQDAIKETERIRKAAEAEAAAAADKKNRKELLKNAKEFAKEIGEELAEENSLALEVITNQNIVASEELTDFELENLEQQLATELRLKMEAAKDEIELTKEKEAAKKEITDAAIEAAGQIVSDRLTAGIDEDLARSQIESDSKQKILDDELDKGAISKEEFARKSAAIDLKFRQEAAKAEKKKALYDIAIATAVAIAKVIPNPVAMAIAAALGGVQLAVVASKPLPKFEEGEVDVKGKRHSQGGIDVNIEDGESVINRSGTSNAKNLLTAINKGLIKDDILLPSAGKMFSGADSGELAKEHHSSIIGMEKLIKEQQLTRKAISNQPQHIHQTTWAGYKYIIKKANHTIIRKDKYFG